MNPLQRTSGKNERKPDYYDYYYKYKRNNKKKSGHRYHQIPFYTNSNEKNNNITKIMTWQI